MCFHICVCKQRQLIDCVYPGASLSFIRFLSQRVRFRKEVESRTFPTAVKRSELELPKLYIGRLFLFRV